MIRAVIIDDERPAREYLNNIIEKYFFDIKVIAEADTVTSAIDVLSKYEVDLVFLDINLSDGSGFNILEELENINFYVIFITAFNNYAIRAFKVNALDYILKPINIEELKNALFNAKKRLDQDKNELIKKSLDNLRLDGQNTRLAIQENNGVHFVTINEITRCKADDNYTEFHLKGGGLVISSRTLKEYSAILEEHGFFRIHRSHLVNLKQIKKILRNRGTQVEMKNGDLLEVSRRKKEELNQKVMDLLY